MSLTMRSATASALLFLPTILRSQPGPGTVSGRTIDGTDSLVVAAVPVLLAGSREVRSNGRGAFTIAGVAPGSHQISVDHFGYKPFLDRVDVVAGQTVAVDLYLTRDTTLISQMTVSGRSVRVPSGFEVVYERAADAQGLLITREHIDSTNPRNIAALLHDVPDVRVNLNSNATDRITTSNCRPTLPGADVTGQPTRVIFNGAPVTQRAWLNDVLTNIAPSMIQAIEIYNGSIMVPPRFQPACAVIAIWTRKQ